MTTSKALAYWRTTRITCPDWTHSWSSVNRRTPTSTISPSSTSSSPRSPFVMAEAGVQVDEPRGHHQALALQDLRADRARVAQGLDLLVAHQHVGLAVVAG